MQLHFQVVDLKLAHSWKIARTAGSSNSKVIVVKLDDSSGITGLGEQRQDVRAFSDGFWENYP